MPKDAAYYTELAEWFDGGGRAAVLHFLESRDLSGFNPHARPPITPGKEDLIAQSRSATEAYLDEALASSAVPFDKDLVVINDVTDFLATARCMRVTRNQVAAALRRAEATELGQKRVDANGRKPRVWALRNAADWATADENDIAAAYVKPSSAQPQGTPGAAPYSAQPKRIRPATGPNL